MMNDKIFPISFLDRSQCLNCKSDELYLIQKDVDAIRLLTHGVLGTPYNLYHESYVLCRKCNSKFEYNKHGFMIVPISDSVYLNKISESRLQIKTKNPFSKEE